MADANEFQKAYLENQRRLKKDVRPMIARSGFYNPENDPVYEYQEYPKTIMVATRERIVYSRQEENDALGIKDKPAEVVDVDIAAIEQPQTVVVKRGRPPKAKSVELPANLE